MSQSIAPATILDARTRLIDAAEKLFAEHGYHAVSLRTIMAEAGVNVAAAHYHFGSKTNLLSAVFSRWAARINGAREERLAACAAVSGPEKLAAVLEAYLAPALEICAEQGGQRFVRISALASVDPSEEVQQVIRNTYDGTAKLFVKALREACPSMTPSQLYWRLGCVFGAMTYLRVNNGRVAWILDRSPPALDRRAVREALNELVPFLVAGFARSGAARRR